MSNILNILNPTPYVCPTALRWPCTGPWRSSLRRPWTCSPRTCWNVSWGKTPGAVGGGWRVDKKLGEWFGKGKFLAWYVLLYLWGMLAEDKNARLKWDVLVGSCWVFPSNYLVEKQPWHRLPWFWWISKILRLYSYVQVPQMASLRKKMSENPT